MKTKKRKTRNKQRTKKGGRAATRKINRKNIRRTNRKKYSRKRTKKRLTRKDGGMRPDMSYTPNPLDRLRGVSDRRRPIAVSPEPRRPLASSSSAAAASQSSPTAAEASRPPPSSDWGPSQQRQPMESLPNGWMFAELGTMGWVTEYSPATGNVHYRNMFTDTSQDNFPLIHAKAQAALDTEEMAKKGVVDSPGKEPPVFDMADADEDPAATHAYGGPPPAYEPPAATHGWGESDAQLVAGLVRRAARRSRPPAYEAPAASQAGARPWEAAGDGGEPAA
jgi:hypothetical protein